MDRIVTSLTWGLAIILICAMGLVSLMVTLNILIEIMDNLRSIRK